MNRMLDFYLKNRCEQATKVYQKQHRNPRQNLVQLEEGKYQNQYICICITESRHKKEFPLLKFNNVYLFAIFFIVQGRSNNNV